MSDLPQEPREPRNERTTIALTVTEKAALRFVASARGTTEAEIIRERVNLHEIIDLHARMVEKLAEVA